MTRRRQIRKVCRTAQPDVIYHAAAYKHVGMLERDACAAAQANTLGTYYAARAARDVGSRFVLVSTDKAFSPLSVMGASKQLDGPSHPTRGLSRSRRRVEICGLVSSTPSSATTSRTSCGVRNGTFARS